MEAGAVISWRARIKRHALTQGWSGAEKLWRLAKLPLRLKAERGVAALLPALI